MFTDITFIKHEQHSPVNKNELHFIVGLERIERGAHLNYKSCWGKKKGFEVIVPLLNKFDLETILA